jgi:sterol desaturase/sphingolipid hydroxylase (fatty acid hydroxylase superfamily)
MAHYWDIFIEGFVGYGRYLWGELTFGHDWKPWFENYFYLLILVSYAVWGLERWMPWRKNQRAIRKDFWLDGFYMFFNFFLFSLIGYNAVSNVVVEAFNQGLGIAFGIENLVAIEVTSWPRWTQLLLMFVLVDFISWWTHRLLHRVPWLWKFHQVHHSVKEMGFAAHLRYHWMETVVYKSIQYLPLAMIGFGLQDFFFVHFIALLIGHINHANVGWDYGPLRYILNNPKMHIWHHAKAIPTEGPLRYGVNFGISLSLWDYLFGTSYIPHDGRDIELGYDGDENMPDDFLGQTLAPFQSNRPQSSH